MANKKNRLLVFLRDKNKKSYFKIIKEVITLWIIKKEVPYYYFKYLYRKDVINYKDYISTKEAHRINHTTVFHKDEFKNLISNKLYFSLFCKENNLPIPQLISYNFNNTFYFQGKLFKINNDDNLIAFFNEVFKKTKRETLFIKPFDLYGGQGCLRLEKDKLKYQLKENKKYLLSHNCIHEETVIQNEKVNEIHSSCINTIRVESFIDKYGKIHILSAFMRFGIGNSYVDNAHSGGFYVGINLEEGSLKEIGHQYMEYGGAKYTHHPDNNFKLEGFKIPFFKEVKELVVKSTSCIPDRYIGWDIAIGENGPIIIEANEYPSIFMADIAYGGYLKHPLYKGIIEEVS